MNAQINSVYAELGIAIPRHCIQQRGTAHLLLLTLEFTCLLSSEQDVLKGFNAITDTVLQHSKWRSSALHSSTRWHLIAFVVSLTESLGGCLNRLLDLLHTVS